MAFTSVLYFVIAITMYFNVNLNLINSIYSVAVRQDFRLAFSLVASKNKVLKYRRRLTLSEIDAYPTFVVG